MRIMSREPARIIGFIAAVAGGIAAAVTLEMGWAEILLVGIPIISAEVTRWFVKPVPPEQRGMK
jgi:hypothetical protein